MEEGEEVVTFEMETFSTSGAFGLLEEASKGGGGDLAMVDVMEQQLVRLSGLLSEREEEIEQLKLTVERECLERGNLIAELSRARQGRKNM